jgi:hypothetical protein
VFCWGNGIVPVGKSGLVSPVIGFTLFVGVVSVTSGCALVEEAGWVKSTSVNGKSKEPPYVVDSGVV